MTMKPQKVHSTHAYSTECGTTHTWQTTLVVVLTSSTCPGVTCVRLHACVCACIRVWVCVGGCERESLCVQNTLMIQKNYGTVHRKRDVNGKLVTVIVGYR